MPPREYDSSDDDDDSDDDMPPPLISRQHVADDSSVGSNSSDDSEDDAHMPRLLGGGEIVHSDPEDNKEKDKKEDSSDDDSVPPLEERNQGGDDDSDSLPDLLGHQERAMVSDSEDDDEEPPPLETLNRGTGKEKAKPTRPKTIDSDDDSDDGSLPDLIKQNNREDSSEGGSDDDEDSDDDDIPPLLPRAAMKNQNAGYSDGDESSGDEPSAFENAYGKSRSNTKNQQNPVKIEPSPAEKKKPRNTSRKKKKVEVEETKTGTAQALMAEHRRKQKEERQERERLTLQAQETLRRREELRRIQAEEEARERKRQKEAEKKRKQKARKKARDKIEELFLPIWKLKKAKKRSRAMNTVASFGQRFFRGNQARKIWTDKLRRRLIMVERYNKLWEPTIKIVEDYTDRKRLKRKRQQDQFKSWASCLETLDFVVNDDTNDETAKILNEAADKALRVEEADEEEDEQVQDDIDYDAQMAAVATTATTSTEEEEEVGEFMGNHTNIMYTENVKKWLRGPAGGRYRDLFVKRMIQLSKGERSRILAKRLKGSSKTVTVFETYLEQKSGKRILWQIEGNNLLVWFVANHDDVSRLLKLIEDSQDRKNRRLTSGDALVQEADPDSLVARRNTIEREAILNPLGNTPMKVYEVSLDDVNEIAKTSWVPKLRLTREEREVVETSGTVLLLGRSGTGKTICTANRMDYDREQMKHDPSFTQLFVARSQKLCSYVENVIGVTERTTFETYDRLKQRLERELPTKNDIRSSFPTELKMRFDVFKREVYNGDQDLDPLLAWTSIRSFIKGSIEATLKPSTPKALSQEEFLDMTVFSSGRCSLTVEQRKIVYPIYERYVRFLNKTNMWDDCDRILALLLRLEHCKTMDPDKYHSVQISKIYVDEVQDYTQAECLLFFYLCNGQGNLFLAGDPAQNVVQGVEFRFQDIRSVEYHIAKDNNTVMQKPKKVHVNFRSHAGILNTAGAILTCMFKAFPKSAENLGEDHGVFVGPRPGVFEKVDIKVLADLLANKMNGTVVLVHDSTLQKWTKALNYPLIRTIRESKGLEYKSVIVLDFFGDLCDQVDESVQKAWRGLLTRGETDGLSTRFPEIESHLKLLYTAVTRCIEQLFFVETTETIPGQAFVRWLTTTTTEWHKKKEESEALATRSKILDVQARVMTKDEALQSGMQLAAAAEAEGRSDVTACKTLLDQAIYYFELADEMMYKKKAQLHLESIGIRAKLPSLPPKSEDEKEDDVAYAQYRDLESNIARTVGKLLDEGLLWEGRDLCSCLFPYVPKWMQQRLKAQIVVPLE